MINPCNSNGIYIQYAPEYDLPTHYGSRATLPYVKPTPELYSKHKLLLLKNTYFTGGPGVQYFNATTQIPYTLGKNSVRQKDKIFTVPCGFQQFIELIQLLLDEGKSIQSILNYLSFKYKIPYVTLTNCTYQTKNFYKYSYVNVDSPKNNKNTINNSAPFKIGEPLSNINLQPILDDIVVKPFTFVTVQYASKIYVSNNENNTYTNDFKELFPTGTASFFGALLLNNYYLQNPSSKYQSYAFVIPQYTTQYKSYGFIVDSTSYNIPGLTGLIYLPIQTYSTLITFQPYPLGMPFMVYFNTRNVLDAKSLPCRFKKYIPFIVNQKGDTITHE